MSADDYALIRERQGRFFVTEEWASATEPRPIRPSDRSFSDLRSAVEYANGLGTEYGITVSLEKLTGSVWPCMMLV